MVLDCGVSQVKVTTHNMAETNVTVPDPFSPLIPDP